MRIIEYEDKYLEDVKDLLVELEEYILTIDQDDLDQLHPDYREKMALLDLQEVKDNDGKCFLAIENDKAIGLIMGTIVVFDEYDYLDYKCPKEGEITELIVTSKIRSKGVGQALMNRMEEYFKSLGCEYILVDVFAYNENGIKFYDKQGYHPRMHTGIKKIK
ncbi:MAG: GNAT family N-acetyltransferase [Candidatus Coprovivens sp.]